MENRKNKDKSTIAVHGLGRPKISVKPVNPPIIQSTNFYYDSTEQMKRFHTGDKSVFVYSRYDNPTILEVEGHIAGLENTDKALIFSSGLGAVSSTVFAFVKQGDEILAGDTLYGGTFDLLKEILPNLGVKVNFFDSRNFTEAESLVNKNTKLIFLESPTNPNLKLTDFEEAADFSNRHNLISVMDNTFATPMNQNPLDYGFNLVLHSGSKYFSGNSDVICGAVAGSDELIEKIWQYRKLFGTILDPSAGFLMLKGIKTLAVRVAKHNENGLKIAEFCESHPKIEKVHYPGLPSHPQHSLAKKQMRGFGGMVTIELKGGQETAERFMDNLELILNAVSLGGVESLATMPVLTTQYGYTEEELKKAEISPSMVRLSLGIEYSDDLIADIKQALDKI